VKRLWLATALVAACGASKPAPREHHVSIHAMQFDPATLEVAVGDTIVWTNEDLVPHTATAAGVFDSGPLVPHATWSYTVASAGTVGYVCTFHPTMAATFKTR
jgi:plastocyanin